MKPFKIDGKPVRKKDFDYIGAIHTSTKRVPGFFKVKKKEVTYWRMLVDKKGKVYEVEQDSQGHTRIKRKVGKKEVIVW
jgi:hypothetical protein